MNIIILFTNIGTYHTARLKAASEAFSKKNWKLVAVQISNNTFDHPWGELNEVDNLQIETLLPKEEIVNNISRENWRKINTELIKLLNNIDPKIIFIPGWSLPITKNLLKWCEKNSAYPILMSESKKNDSKRSIFKEAIKKYFYVKKFKSALVGCQTHKDYLISLGMPAEKIYYGYDVVDNNYFFQQTKFYREKYDIEDNKFNSNKELSFLCVTRMIKRKNLIGLLEAYKIYRDKKCIGALNLVICGSGEQEVEIKQYLKVNQLEQFVHLPGFVGYQELPKFFAKAIALIHPAYVEQWGLVINEACAAGLPILSSYTVGATEGLVKSGENGYLFSPDDKIDMANKLMLIQNIDQNILKEMGKNSQKLVKNYEPNLFGVGAVNAIETIIK